MSRVSFSLYSPMEGNNWGETVYIEGQAPPPPDSDQNQASWVRVSDGYFDTIGTKIVQGRAITDQDTATSQRVAVVNQIFAKKFFKDESPIGKHFGYWDPKYAGNFEIVGVTENTEYRQPTRPIPPMFFLSALQSVTYDDPRFVTFENSSHYLNAIELQTLGNVPGLEPQVRHALAQVNPDLAVIDFVSFADQVQQNFSQQAMIAKLTSLFGLLALVLASVGLYGVTAYSVERRTSEIGIRMALGADRFQCLKAGPPGSVSADWNRAGDWHSRDHPRRPGDGYATLWREALRSKHSAPDNRGAEFCRIHCGHRAGSPGSNAPAYAGAAH